MAAESDRDVKTETDTSIPIHLAPKNKSKCCGDHFFQSNFLQADRKDSVDKDATGPLYFGI